MKQKRVDGFPKESSEYQELWSLYNKGIADYKEQKLDEGVKSFLTCFESVQKNKKAKPEEFRIAGLCLKKIGWYYRGQKEYHKAFAYHSMRLSLVREFGSANEVHDALISLDVDVYMLNDMHLSERFLIESLEYAQEIKDDKSRVMALGTSYNNLSGTFSGLERFDESIEYAHKAFEYWEKYEAIAGTEEMKLPWAYYAIGDALDNAGKSDEAQPYFIKANELASQRNMPADSIKWIKERIKN